MGADLPPAAPRSFLGISAVPGPRLVFHPSFALFPHELPARFPNPREVHISSESTLVLEGAEVVVESLRLSGSLSVKAAASVGARVRVVGSSRSRVENMGHEMVELEEMEGESREVDRMRGYRLVVRDVCLVDTASRGCAPDDEYVLAGASLVPADGYEPEKEDDEREAEKQAPGDGLFCCAPFSVLTRNCIRR